MKIIAFRVTKYRNVEDSGEIRLLDRLTCIVGKNQSGKTAILRALYKFNPFDPDPYDMRREWPRGQRTAQNTEQIVCRVKFELDHDEVIALGQFAANPIRVTEVEITKDYGGTFGVRFPQQPDLFPDTIHPSQIDAACAVLTAPDEVTLGPDFSSTARECIEEVKRIAKEGRFKELAGMRSAHQQRIQTKVVPAGTQPTHNAQNQFVQQYVAHLSNIEKALSAGLTMHQQAHQYLVERIPTFIFMEDYKTFHGRANLEKIKRKRDNQKSEPLDEEEETFLMILALAGLDLEQLIKQGASGDQSVIHDRQLDLDDAAGTLTKQVAGRWGQNDYRIEFRADGQVFFTDIEETSKNIGMIPLEEQSKGFQWFFSFDLHFMHDSRGTFEGCVLLLDEPGLHLHPGAQADLLSRLDAYSEKNTTIYTTHLPFLIDLREASRIRVINQLDGAAVVSENLGESGPQEKMTLQAALGMKANQSFLVADRNLVVEGPDDYWILSELSNVLERAGEAALPDDVMITAAGSASQIVPMATFMIGQNLKVVALFDSDEAGREAEEKLRTQWITRYKDSKSATILFGVATGVSGDFMIEDLFPEDYYVEKLRSSHAQKLLAVGKKPEDVKLSGTGTILSRAEDACQAIGIAFNKGSVAKLIRKDLIAATGPDRLPKNTAEMARKVFAAINKEFV